MNAEMKDRARRLFLLDAPNARRDRALETGNADVLAEYVGYHAEHGIGSRRTLARDLLAQLTDLAAGGAA